MGRETDFITGARKASRRITKRKISTRKKIASKARKISKGIARRRRNAASILG